MQSILANVGLHEKHCVNFLALVLGLLPASAQAEEDEPAELRHPHHAWLVELRVLPQLTWIEGDVEASTQVQSGSIDLRAQRWPAFV